MSSAPAAEVLAELRRARRKQRWAGTHWIDALYQVYITAFLAIAAVLVLSGLTGDGKMSAKDVHDAVRRGPAAVGLLVAVALMIGLRSGCRGGPLALEQPDVRHVLLSPIDRGAALRSPALHQLRFLSFTALVVGAVAGQLAVRRLGGGWIPWVVCGALTCLLAVWLSVGSAMLASGRRLKPWMGSVLGLVLILWSALDLSGRGPSAPLSYLGRLALWPLHFDALAIIPAAICVAVVAVGVRSVAGLSLEAAERRTALVGQMKFAVTLQDLRTVLVLRRQLAMELPRTDPWFGHPPSSERTRPTRFPVWGRGWRGVLRWPITRVLRLVVLAAVAGLALRGAWNGTTPLVVLGGLALWVAALDVIEPMAQETDHPGRLDAYPLEKGQVLVAHLPVTFVAMIMVTLLAAAVAVLVDPSIGALRVAALAVLPAAGAAVAGAVISVLMGAPKPVDNLAMISPEMAGMRNLLRTVGPPLMGVIGTAPLLAARAALRNHLDSTQVELAASLAVLTAVGLTVGWVRFREDIHAWFTAMMAEAKVAQTQRGSQKGGARGPRVDDDED